jgi:O-antigen/teichoic acid export membrane protein
MNLFEKLKKTDERSLKTYQNIVYTFVTKGMGIFLNFLLVPLCIDYISPVEYGIWLTLTSVVGWFSSLDLGLGNGLRVKLSENFAKNDLSVAQANISSAYIIISSVVFIIITFFLIINQFIDWTLILNTEKKYSHELSIVSIVVFVFFFIKLISDLVYNIYNANQIISFSNFFNFFNNLLIFITILILKHFISGNLIIIGLVLSGVPVLVNSIVTIYSFKNKYRLVIPKFKFFDFDNSKQLLKLGLKYFIIQITSVILFTTDNFIIAQFFNPIEVTKYNIVQKYFSIGTILVIIILTPLISAYADAYFKRDIGWIKNKIRKSFHLYKLLIFLTIIMVLFSPYIYKAWIGRDLNISIYLSIAMGFNILIMSFGSIYMPLINGIGRINFQVWLTIIIVPLKILVSIILIKYFHFSLIAVVMANILCNFINGIFIYFEYKKIMNYGENIH